MGGLGHGRTYWRGWNLTRQRSQRLPGARNIRGEGGGGAGREFSGEWCVCAGRGRTASRVRGAGAAHDTRRMAPTRGALSLRRRRHPLAPPRSCHASWDGEPRQSGTKMGGLPPAQVAPQVGGKVSAASNRSSPKWSKQAKCATCAPLQRVRGVGIARHIIRDASHLRRPRSPETASSYWLALNRSPSGLQTEEKTQCPHAAKKSVRFQEFVWAYH